jgi:hypothetical protein
VIPLKNAKIVLLVALTTLAAISGGGYFDGHIVGF